VYIIFSLQERHTFVLALFPSLCVRVCVCARGRVPVRVCACWPVGTCACERVRVCVSAVCVCACLRVRGACGRVCVCACAGLCACAWVRASVRVGVCTCVARARVCVRACGKEGRKVAV